MGPNPLSSTTLRKRIHKPGPGKTAGTRSGGKWLVALGIAALTAAVYWQATGNSFINYDDNLYVTNNPQVQAGLGWNGIVWAFSTSHTGNWIPITWLSHMLDCQLYGLSAAGHHLTSLLIHLANAILVFFLFQKLTAHVWRSAFVAAIFALHPINVESVAWVAERKNVLCTLLWLLTIWAYIGYAGRPDWKRYLLVVIAFAMTLMSKPMAVTLPFVLLLLDYWPLGRLRVRNRSTFSTPGPTGSSRSQEPTAGVAVSRLVLEKVPLVLLALGDGLITLRAQRESGSVGATQVFPVGLRIENALVSYARYIWNLIWPAKLAVFYPYPKSYLPAWQVGLAAIVFLGITVLVISRASRFKYPAIAWLWYLGTLVPVIGLVQVGGQSMADRYAYIPMLGVLILAAWGVSDITRNRRLARDIAVISALVVVSGFAIVARGQLSYWADSETLFDHSQSVTANNYVAYNNLGEALAGKGKTDEAALWFAKAVETNPDYAAAQENLGMALIQKGSLDDGIVHAIRATQLDPHSYDAFNKLGAALAKKGQMDEAVADLNRAVEIDPSFAPAWANLGIVLDQQGKLDEAAASFQKAIQYAGNVEMAVQLHYRLGNVLTKKGDAPKAAEHYREALRLKPDFSPAVDALRKISAENR
jgi:Tfp pilus assembly protein PilF